MLGVLALAALFVGAIASVVVQEVTNFIDEAPSYVRDVERFANDHLGLEVDADKIIKDIQNQRGTFQNLADDLAGRALDVTATVLELLLQIVTVLVFAFYMTADGPRLRRSICSLLPPARQRTVLDTWEVAIEKTGGYFFSRGIQAFISAFATWAFLQILGVPYPLALGLWVGVVSQFIPTIGTYIAMVLPVLIALTRHPLDGLLVLGFLVLYQQFENYVIGPRITRRTMNVHPALAIGTVFVGAALVGPIGAVLALPATGVIQALISAYAQRYEVIDANLTEMPERERRRRTVAEIVGTMFRRSEGSDATVGEDEPGASSSGASEQGPTADD
jgi:predicted PurR-regulated permease PerM